MSDRNPGKIHQLTDSVRRYLGRTLSPRVPNSPGHRADVISIAERFAKGNAAFLKTIWSKIQSDEPLARFEWETLLELAREAYVDMRFIQLSVATGPLIAVLCGFRDFLRLRNATYPGQSFSTDQYYVTRLSPLVDGLKQDSRSGAWKHDPVDVISSVIKDLRTKPAFKADAAYLVQLFQGAISEEPAVDSARLSQSLAAYTLAVFRLAARGCALRDEHRRNWSQTSFLQENPDRIDAIGPCFHAPNFSHDDLRLNLYPDAHNMTGVLSLHADQLLIGFDFIKLEHWADVLFSGVESRSLIVREDGFVLQDGPYQVDLPADRVNQLKQLFRQYTDSDALREDRERMFNYWGQV